MGYNKLIRGKALYVTPDRIWVSRGMSFFAVNYNGKRISRRYSIGTWPERVLSSFRLSRQLFRIGLHHLLPLRSGNYLVTARRKTFIVAPNGNVLSVFQGYQGNKPGHQGVCVTPDGTIFFAEYILNPNRDKEVNLYRSTDNGMSFHIIKTWPAGDIRHLHFVKWDNYEKCLWLGSGDYGVNGAENRLYKSQDNGETWVLVGQGGQDWRAIGVCFTEDSLLWGTDAGSCSDPVHFVKMERKSYELKVLADFEGPCHGCASYKDGRSLFSTGVEGGENEKDRFSRLKEFKNGEIVNLLKLKKDIWPFILQYGVMRFPLGTENCDRVVFTAMALKGYGESIIIET